MCRCTGVGGVVYYLLARKSVTAGGEATAADSATAATATAS
jgi:hypothetical protein